MSIFDITPDQDFEVVRRNALNETLRFFIAYGRSMCFYEEYEKVKMHCWDSSYVYTEDYNTKSKRVGRSKG